ncbi:epoxide hydrolase family protein [Bradyrhizobium sp. DOA1]|uniref:epoxide hydrolase family protein n=1 Tax=Bradyrhizobium sp. DOA1 TaxID=1126616 RepID=UPI00077C15B8|nr:epoxide hydrolase family protein [Bradyrhizobium sp. DOA1]KYH03029.1 epoxide hydrolase [Bradyrhizobium sp. DOA1]
MTAIKPFRIAISDDVLADLKSRLARTRWPEAELVDDWSQGAPLQWIQEICRYWASDYDWRAREAKLNRFEQFTTEIDGLDIHFIHARSKEANALPLIITHGWPGSIVEFQKVIAPLTDPAAHGGNPADAFHVICPSLPGFGFSAKPKTTGWGVDRIAATWAKLMERLGYARYGAQGGDWGSAVTTSLGAQDAARCAGIHITLSFNSPPRTEGGDPTAEEKRALAGLKHYVDLDSGYSKQQSTRPQTLGYGLTDSPSGQAAWILEKFWAWTDCDGHPENIFTRDELLDNVMLYWATETATSSARLYWESFGKRRTTPVVKVPTGVAAFPKEIITPVRRWMEPNFPNITHWSEMEKGGHFAAFEQPELFVRDVRKFFATVR